MVGSDRARNASCRGNALLPKEARVALLSTWLEALYDDFGWMEGSSRMGDRRLIEDCVRICSFCFFLIEIKDTLRSAPSENKQMKKAELTLISIQLLLHWVYTY
nr:hypothetical protein [Tanacetum cinerariifolium]